MIIAMIVSFTGKLLLILITDKKRKQEQNWVLKIGLLGRAISSQYAVVSSNILKWNTAKMSIELLL